MATLSSAIKKATKRAARQTGGIRREVISRMISFFKTQGPEFEDLGPHATVRTGTALYVSVQTHTGSAIVAVIVQNNHVLFSKRRNRHFFECLVVRSNRPHVLAEGSRGKFIIEDMYTNRRQRIPVPASGRKEG